MTRKSVLTFITAALTTAVGQPIAATDTLRAELHPAKSDYSQFEPIELVLTLKNISNLPIRVPIRYPRPGGIEIRSDGPVAKPAPKKGPAIGQVRSPLIDLAPSESFSLSVFLQRFVPQPEPGLHAVPYSMDLQCMPPDGYGTCRLAAHGTLNLQVDEGDEGLSERILPRYAADVDSENYWEQVRAEEALCVTGSPAVLPYLERLLADSLTGCAVAALTKFRGNEDAQRLALSLARLSSDSQTYAALEVLEAWEFELDEADLRTLLARETIGVRLEALRYAQEIATYKYFAAVTEYVNDPHLVVVDLAGKVQAVLISAKF